MNIPVKIPKNSAKAPLNAVEEVVRIERIVEAVSSRVAPAFDIRDMVAVNPFLGYSGGAMLETNTVIEQLFHTEILPAKATLVEAFRAEEFGDEDLMGALGETPEVERVDEAALLDYVTNREEETPRGPRFETNLDQLTDPFGKLLASGLAHSATRFLAAYYDRTVSRWYPESKEKGLFSSYLSYAARDRNPEILGLKGFRNLAGAQEPDALAHLAKVVASHRFDDETAVLYFGRLLAKLNGWASFLRSRAWVAGEPRGDLPELLAMLVFLDGAARELGVFAGRPRLVAGDPRFAEERRLRLLTLRAKERAFLRGVARKFAAPSEGDERPSVQAVFCIDVRSERLRRRFEAKDAKAETYGFAGFFGLPVSFSDRERNAAPHCPPLLRPARDVKISAGDSIHAEEGIGAGVGGFLARLKSGPIGALTTVEGLGFGYGVSLLRDAFGYGGSVERAPLSVRIEEIPLEERVRLARSMLKNIGLRAPLAPLVFLVGHDSHVTNNPQAAGLSCGACAGHGGDKNALLAAAILNDRNVRVNLAESSSPIPDDVLFVAALHETTTDRVLLVNPGLIPGSRRGEVETVLGLFDEASAEVRSERATALFSEEAPSLERFAARGSSIGETRPEWALARNAAFLVTRRCRTRSADLEGRAFLHSYDETRDPDGSVLELILTAPAVVGSWINLQYYASSVAPKVFGSGTKTLHNVVGGFGVLEGNDGDLAVGLSLESVSDGERLYHEPLRLQVVVEASEERIDGIVKKHASLGDLVRGEWIFLYALDRASSTLKRYDPRSGFSGAAA